MNKLLLFSALALAASPSVAQSLGPVGGETTTENLTFSVISTYGAKWVTGLGSMITFTESSGEFYLAKIENPSKVKSVSVSLSSRTGGTEYSENMALRMRTRHTADSEDTDSQATLLEEVGKTYTIELSTAEQAKSGLYLEIQRADENNEVTCSVGSVTINYTNGTSENVTVFDCGGWGYKTPADQTSGTAVMDGPGVWGAILITDANGNDIVWDPETDSDTEFTFTINFSALEGEMLFEFDDNTTAATDFINTDKNIIPIGETSASFTVNRDTKTNKGNTAIKLVRLYLKNWGNSKESPEQYSVSIAGGTLTKSKYVPTSLKPVSADILSTEYFSLTGVKSNTPHKGLNLVRRTLSDGSVQVEKALIK